MKAQLTGMRGVYLVAAEMSRLGFIASPTSRSAAAADILVTDQACRRAYSVQVKTNAAPAGEGSYWLTGKHTMVSDTHIYVLVNLQSKEDRTLPEYFVVPSAVMKDRTGSEKSQKGDWHWVSRKDVLEYKDGWGIFGDPEGELKVEEQSVSEEVQSSGDDQSGQTIA